MDTGAGMKIEIWKRKGLLDYRWFLLDPGIKVERHRDTRWGQSYTDCLDEPTLVGKGVVDSGIAFTRLGARWAARRSARRNSKNPTSTLVLEENAT